MSRAADGRRNATVVEGVRAVLGAVHLLRARSDRTTATFNRVLGVRQIVQAGVLSRAVSGDAHTVGAAIDATHAVTMLPLMLVGGRWRRVAVQQFFLAAALAIAEVALVGTGRKR